MTKRSLFRFLAVGLASAFLFAVSAPAEAAGIDVFADSGGGSGDIVGTALGVDVTSNTYMDIITSVNNVTLGGPLFPALSLTESVTSWVVIGPGIQMPTGGFGSKTIDDGISSVTLDFVITGGIIAGSHYNVDGTITAVSGSNDVFGYDFTKLLGGTVSVGIEHAGTDFSTFNGNTSKSQIAAGLGLQENAVPEPTSLGLLGIGMTGFLAFRRFFKRTSVA